MTLDAGSGTGLTELRPSDKHAFVSLLNNPNIYRCTLGIPYPFTAADFEKWFAKIEKTAHENEHATVWAIRDSTEQLIGMIGLDSQSDGHAHRAEIGYWLGEPYWGRGISTAVVRAVCRHGFQGLGLAKITANIFSFNGASVRVVEKCDFELEGHLKKHYLKDGEFIDAKAYGLVR
jgi:RimJ/RimL family protein N-acetyltransferase